MKKEWPIFQSLAPEHFITTLFKETATRVACLPLSDFICRYATKVTRGVFHSRLVISFSNLLRRSNFRMKFRQAIVL